MKSSPFFISALFIKRNKTFCKKSCFFNKKNVYYRCKDNKQKSKTL